MEDEVFYRDYMDFVTWYLTKRMRCELGTLEDEEVVTEWYINHLKEKLYFN